MILFDYMDSNGRIRLEIGKKVMFGSQAFDKIGTVRTTRSTNIVNFHYVDQDFSNSFLALSSVKSLTTVFLRRQFGENKKKASIRLSVNGHLEWFVAKKVSSHNGELPALGLQRKGSNGYVFIDIPLIHHLHSALNKALNWIAPPQIFDDDNPEDGIRPYECFDSHFQPLGKI